VDLPINRLAPSAAEGLEEEVGAEAEEQADEDPRAADDLQPERPVHAQELDDHIEDRAGGEPEEGDRERRVDDGLADECAEDRRSAADQPERGQKRPARTDRASGKRRDDAEPLRRVVEREADDEGAREREFPSGCRLADREAFGEVVEPDPDGDEDREFAAGDGGRAPGELAHGRRSGADATGSAGGEPAFIANEAQERHGKADGDGRCEERELAPGAGPRDRLVERRFDHRHRGAEHVPEEEQQDPDRHCAQEGAQGDAGSRQPPHRQADEDRRPCDDPEGDDLFLRHGAPSAMPHPEQQPQDAHRW
jgi:hypothetical protein